MEQLRHNVERVPLLDWDHEDTDVTPATDVGRRYRLPLPPPPPEPEPCPDPCEEWPTMEMATRVTAPGEKPEPIPKPVAQAQPRPDTVRPTRGSVATSCCLITLAAAAAAAAIVGITALV